MREGFISSYRNQGVKRVKRRRKRRAKKEGKDRNTHPVQTKHVTDINSVDEFPPLVGKLSLDFTVKNYDCNNKDVVKNESDTDECLDIIVDMAREGSLEFKKFPLFEDSPCY